MTIKIRSIKPSGNTLNGIFKEVMKQYSDPVSSGIFTLEGPTLYGALSYLVTGAGDWASSQGSTYFEISFNTFFMHPTHYTMRGASVNWCYQKTWEIYGYNFMERSNSKNWTLLGKDYDKATSTCSNGTLCAGKGTSTFPLTYTGNKYFRYIRFIATETSCGPHIVSSGIDFYGSLISDIYYGNNDRTCKPKRTGISFIQYMILLFIS